MKRVEMVALDGKWTALMHCDCRTTLTGRGRRPEDALSDAQDAFDLHLAKNGDKCGTANHAQVDCGCDQCREHNILLALRIARMGAPTK